MGGGLRSATRYIGDRERVTARVENRFRNDVADNRPSVVIMWVRVFRTLLLLSSDRFPETHIISVAYLDHT